MKQVRKAIHAALKEKTDNGVYFGENNVPSDAVFPYIVYTIELYSTGHDSDIVVIDITGWDNQDDSTDLEDMMSSIEELDKAVIPGDDNMKIILYLESMTAPESEAEELNRRLYTFNGNIY